DDFERLESYEHANPEASENEFDAEERSAPERSYEDLSEYARRDTGGDRDAKMDAMAAAPARGLSLAEQLSEQWGITDVDPLLKPLGNLIISFLDEDGYLRTPLETIIDRAPRSPGEEPITLESLTRALEALQLFLEPAGVAARNPAECLRLQLDALENDQLEQHDDAWPHEIFAHARVLVDHHLDDLMQNRLPKVSEKTGLTIDGIRSALSLLKRLSLAPARRLVDDASRPIIPDAIVEYQADEDRYIAYLNDSRLPNLRINQEYAKLTKTRGVEKKDKEFLRTNISNAQWLMDAVQQRKHTLLRVVNAVVAAQRDFFDYGPQALKPLPMTGVAEQLGIHVATVSRAVADKHLATPRGIVALRKFFSGGLQARGEDGGEGEDMAWDAIKAALKDVIDIEDKSKPLSDEALVEELKKKGIDIARRTVAKYRDQLQIPAARLRKRH
ncbi:MAG: RNA polymerase factor sigma-54, partial [bacterium]|nr:RNA polymerase factor sigma-54 [bacterium]